MKSSHRIMVSVEGKPNNTRFFSKSNSIPHLAYFNKKTNYINPVLILESLKGTKEPNPEQAKHEPTSLYQLKYRLQGRELPIRRLFTKNPPDYGTSAFMSPTQIMFDDHMATAGIKLTL